MAAEGHCNCNSIKVSIPAQPGQSVICYCSNCQRAGSAPFSVVYVLDRSEVDIKDPEGVLKHYNDSNTQSGNTIIRQFCSTCGSPIASLPSLDAPKVFLKAGLFDRVPAPATEVFGQNKPQWMQVTKPEEEAKI